MKHGIADCVSFWESLGEKHRTLLESNTIFRIINEIDPKAFVTETNVIGVYGEGFDKFKVRMPKKHPISAEKLAQL